jgi:hypothetical protein
MNRTKQPQKLRRVAIPLAGAVTLSSAASLGFPDEDANLVLVILAFIVGGLLSMLVGWPVLWLTERYFQTPLRYFIAGIVTGLLIWTGCVLPNLVDAITATTAKPFVQPSGFKEGAAFFAFIGAVSGVGAVMIDRFIRLIERTRKA